MPTRGVFERGPLFCSSLTLTFVSLNSRLESNKEEQDREARGGAAGVKVQEVGPTSCIQRLDCLGSSTSLAGDLQARRWAIPTRGVFERGQLTGKRGGTPCDPWTIHHFLLFFFITFKHRVE